MVFQAPRQGVRQLQRKLSSGNLTPEQTSRVTNRINYLGGTPRTAQTQQPQPGAQQPIATQQPTQAQPGLEDLQARRRSVIQQIQSRGGKAQAPGFTKRLGNIDSQIRSLRNTASVPGGETPGAEPPAAPTPEVAPPLRAEPEQDPGLFPSQTAMMPENYQGSPTYKFQQQEGLKALERLMSARGLTKSGAELETNSKFLNQLGAQEADRMQTIAQQEADRLERVQGREADRLANREDSQWRRAMDVINFLGDQNPMKYAYEGLNTYADLGAQRGKSRAGFRRDNYQRVTPRPTGGPSGPAPVFQPPFPSSPDYSMADMIAGQNSSYDNNNFLSSLGNAISRFF